MPPNIPQRAGQPPTRNVRSVEGEKHRVNIHGVYKVSSAVGAIIITNDSMLPT